MRMARNYRIFPARREGNGLDKSCKATFPETALIQVLAWPGWAGRSDIDGGKRYGDAYATPRPKFIS